MTGDALQCRLLSNIKFKVLALYCLSSNYFFYASQSAACPPLQQPPSINILYLLRAILAIVVLLQPWPYSTRFSPNLLTFSIFYFWAWPGTHIYDIYFFIGLSPCTNKHSTELLKGLKSMASQIPLRPCALIASAFTILLRPLMK